MNELKSRGVKDILISAVGGLTGFPEAIATVFPKTEVQLSIVHIVRNSVKFVFFKDKKGVTADLKKIYLAPSEELAAAAPDGFGKTWDAKYPMISRSWRKRWTEVVPFLKFSPDIRKVIYTTTAIESVNFTIRRVIKNQQSFPTGEAAMKLIFMAVKNISKKWTMPLRDWGRALRQFALIYVGRVPL